MGPETCVVMIGGSYDWKTASLDAQGAIEKIESHTGLLWAVLQSRGYCVVRLLFREREISPE